MAAKKPAPSRAKSDETHEPAHSRSRAVVETMPTLDEDIDMKVASVRGVHGAGPLYKVHHDIIVENVLTDVRMGSVETDLDGKNLETYIRSKLGPTPKE